MIVGWLIFHNSNSAKHTTTQSPAAGHVVPAVDGLSEQDAIARLSAAGFAAKVNAVQSTKPRGIVLAQTPGAGARRGTGQVVTLRVSRGTGAVSVPNVLGIPATTATEKLRSVRLRAVSKSFDSTKPAGIVVAQTPAPGEKVDRSSLVTLGIKTSPAAKREHNIYDILGVRLKDNIYFTITKAKVRWNDGCQNGEIKNVSDANLRFRPAARISCGRAGPFVVWGASR